MSAYAAKEIALSTVKDIVTAVVNDPRSSQVVSTGVAIIGVATMQDFIAENIGTIASLVGIITALALSFMQWRRHIIEKRNLKLTEEKLNIEIEILKQERDKKEMESKVKNSQNMV